MVALPCRPRADDVRHVTSRVSLPHFGSALKQLLTPAQHGLFDDLE
jgi:hypothetical protein